MVGIYKIINHDKNTESKINEILLLQLIKLAKYRNSALYNFLIEIWEDLENEKFSEEIIDKL